MKKKLLLFALFMLPINIYGLSYGGCEYSVISKLKSLVTNINLSYDYRIENNTAYFDVTLTNMTPDMYFYDMTNRKYYYYSDTNNGEIIIKNYNNKSGTYKFYSAKNECYGLSLGSKYYKLPSYNKYYNDELCANNSNYSLCQKWSEINYSREEFLKLINDYKNNKEEEEFEGNITYDKEFFDYLAEFYINYYYYLLIAIIVICGGIIIYNKRNNKFKL